MDTSRRPDLDLATVETLSVKPLTDTLVAQLGHDTRSPYTEMFWTPILGPSTTLALRRFAFALAARGPYQVKVAELGQDLGLGGTGNHSPIRCSLKRLVQFDVATWGGGELAVRTHVPTLAPRRLAHLSPLGIEWSPVRQGMAEPAAFNAAHLSAFSLRRAQVTAAMADHRATSAKAAQVATLVSRAAKSTDYDRRRQLATWWDKATSVGLDPEILAQMLGQPREARIEADRRAEVTAHLLGPYGLTAHSSSFERRDVVRAWAEAAADGAHLAQLESLTDAFVAREEVVAIAAGPSGEPRNSTAELMALEAGLIEAARSQRHAGRGMASAEVLHNALADGPDLSYEQVYMVHLPDDLRLRGRASAGTGRHRQDLRPRRRPGRLAGRRPPGHRHLTGSQSSSRAGVGVGHHICQPCPPAHRPGAPGVRTGSRQRGGGGRGRHGRHPRPLPPGQAHRGSQGEAGPGRRSPTALLDIRRGRLRRPGPGAGRQRAHPQPPPGAVLGEARPGRAAIGQRGQSRRPPPGGRAHQHRPQRQGGSGCWSTTGWRPGPSW